MNDLYYGGGCPCGCTGAVTDAGKAEKAIKFDEKLMDKVLREIYNEEIDPKKGEYPKEMAKAARGMFETATAEGFASASFDITEKEDYLKEYMNSIRVFSAFKVHDFAQLMAERLYDDKGELKTFQQWDEDTQDIQAHHNELWLRTEYDTAILRAEQAAEWQQFEKDKDIMPNLRWMPTSSVEPREEHAVFWREALTLPVGDPFWDEHRPGDLWNCKCWLEQTDEEETPRTDLPKEKDMPTADEGLKTNPGKTAEMFDRSHPYYPKPNTCPWLTEARKENRRQSCVGNCNRCKLI